MELLTKIVNSSNHIKCVSLSNQKSIYSQELRYYPFTVKLDKWIGSFNTLNDLSNNVCVPNKTEGLNILVFNMITEKMNQNF